jgi:2-methylcitrate dehydratase PrpD
LANIEKGVVLLCHTKINSQGRPESLSLGSDSLTRYLAKFCMHTKFESFSESQLRTLKFFLLDWLGCAIGGSAEKPTKMVSETIKALGGTKEATSIVDGTKTSSCNAALVNGCASHVLEMDDLHRESIIHPGTVVLPSALAVAESSNASGRDLLTAIAIGYEVFIRTALGVGTDHYYYWHTTATCGGFGAAAAASYLLGLSEDQIVWALGSAGTQAAGLWEFLSESAMSKVLHPGKAAMNGILSALLAQKGFTGPSRILEGDRGFFRATSGNFDVNKVVEGLGEIFNFERCSIKCHASCGHTHSAVDAAIAATDDRKIRAEEVDKIEVRVYQEAFNLCAGVKPETPYLAKFCLPFTVASAILHQRLGLSEFSNDKLNDPATKAILDKISVIPDKSLTEKYPYMWPARVSIFLKNGQCIEGAVDYPKGDPENSVSLDELTAKYHQIVENVISRERADRLAEYCLNIETISDISNFFYHNLFY